MESISSQSNVRRNCYNSRFGKLMYLKYILCQLNHSSIEYLFINTGFGLQWMLMRICYFTQLLEWNNNQGKYLLVTGQYICKYPIMPLDWRPIYGYFNSVPCDCANTTVKIPLYWPPIKVLQVMVYAQIIFSWILKLVYLPFELVVTILGEENAWCLKIFFKSARLK